MPSSSELLLFISPQLSPLISEVMPWWTYLSLHRSYLLHQFYWWNKLYTPSKAYQASKAYQEYSWVHITSGNPIPFYFCLWITIKHLGTYLTVFWICRFCWFSLPVHHSKLWVNGHFCEAPKVSWEIIKPWNVLLERVTVNSKVYSYEAFWV